MKDERKIVITTDGKTTTARLFDGKRLIMSAESKCHPDDAFDFEVGAKLAVDRIFEKKDVEIENGEITVIEPEKKQTGWERAEKGTGYTCISLGAGLCPEIDSYFAPDDVAFRATNYLN